MEILAPTILEYWAVRRVLPHGRANWAGVRLARWKGVRQGSTVVVCGLAGALVPNLPSGTVLIPEQVGLVDGRIMRCDPQLIQALVAAAHSLHFQPDTRPLLTTQSLVVKDARHYWAQRGFVAADMETGLLIEKNLRVATIRVILDNPEHDISADWLNPARALLQPKLWQELFWLGRMAPQYALRAALVLKAGPGTGPDYPFIE
jgi:hypothetical protein